jgi:hypothetical protein
VRTEILGHVRRARDLSTESKSEITITRFRDILWLGISECGAAADLKLEKVSAVAEWANPP